MRPKHHPRAKKLALALLHPIRLRTNYEQFSLRFSKKIKNSQPELKFTGSYKKKSVRVNASSDHLANRPDHKRM